MESPAILHIRVGPFYNGTEDDMIYLSSVARSEDARRFSEEVINDLNSSTKLLSIRKPSPDVLGRVKLKPSYFSFPAPQSGRSPTAPSFRVPRYGYYTISGEDSFDQSAGQCGPSGTAEMKEPVVCAIGIAKNKRKLYFSEAVLNSINYYAGIGVLLLPYSFALTGWTGIVTLAMLSALSYYSGCCIGHCQVKYFLDSLPDIAEFAFDSQGRSIISMTYYLQLLLDVAIFGRLLSQLVSEITHFSSFQATMISLTILIVTVNIFRRNQITNVLSILGNIAFLLMVMTIAVSIIVSGKHSNSVSIISDWSPKGSWESLHETVSIQMYCLSGHIVLPPIIRSMQDSFSYKQLLKCTFATLFIIYTLLASLGYYDYGNHLQGNIIDALQKGSFGHIASMVACAVVLVTKIPLASAPIAEGIAEFIESWIQAKAPPFSFTDFENDYYNTVIRKRLQRIKRKRRYYQDMAGWAADDEEIKTSLPQSEDTMREISFSSPKVGARRDSLQGVVMQKVGTETKDFDNNDSSSASSTPTTVDWEKNLHPPKAHTRLWFVRVLIRSFVQIAAFMTTQIFIDFEQMVILVGGSMGIITTIIIPITCYWRLARYDFCCWEHGKLWIVIFISAIFVVYALMAPFL